MPLRNWRAWWADEEQPRSTTVRTFDWTSAILRRVLILMILAMLASALLAIYVGDDRPGVSDVGQRSISGWLVGVFGVQGARPAGIALFSGLTLFLLGLILLSARRLRPLRRYRWR
jgi:hypothetical protein